MGKYDPRYGQVIHDQLIATFTIASERALLATLQGIAMQADVSTVEGMDIEEFFQRRKTAEAEELIADFADTNVTAASHVKALWTQLQADWQEEAKNKPNEG